MSAVLAQARREVLGFFRRRDSFWIVAGFGAGCAVPLAVLGFGPEITGGGVSRSAELRFAVEVTYNYACALELVALVLLAYALAGRSLGEEVERGSWLLMRLTPAGAERALGGKALGITVVLAAVHGLAASLLLTTVPILRRTHTEVAVSTLGALLLATAAIPEGFAHVSLGSRMWGGPLGFRLLTIGRVGLLLAVLATLFGPRPKQPSPLLVAYWLSHPAHGPDAGWSVRQALAPWVVSLSWLTMSGAMLWRLVVRRWRSVDR